MWLPHRFDPDSITRPHLVTIPYSHYCEVARWALEHGGIDFVEAKYAPGYHVFAVGRLRKDRSTRSASSYVGQESGTHAGRRKFAVPLLCLPDGRVLRDSWEILEYALGVPDPDWQQRLDRELGVCVRQVAYHSILTREGRPLFGEMLASASAFERGLWKVSGWYVQREMRRLMAISEANVRQSEERILGLLRETEVVLDRYGGALQPGGGFGPTELAFCGLAAVCLLPGDYGGGVIEMPELGSFPARYRAFVEACRDTEAGRWVLQSYGEHRQPERC